MKQQNKTPKCKKNALREMARDQDKEWCAGVFWYCQESQTKQVWAEPLFGIRDLSRSDMSQKATVI